ncbi:hypothetical protein [Psychrobacter sanguinis]|uniref:hypothetical protein n=1 Tax=Psychrobacter sanguinis TaxID=861445 RepID=UPI002A74F716|nr:hypothetical protein [Psychrobacter sanguinis]MDY3306660.1 hypothetical protein [Psychrobacter sanguinis]
MSDYQTSLLLSKRVIKLNTNLAVKIGLNEALVLQQLFYWLDKGVEIEGQQWVYKTYDKWQEQDFPFWSVRTIKRTINNLVEKELVIVEKLSDNNFDRKNYYTINFDKLKEYEAQTIDKSDSDKVAQSNKPEEVIDSDKVAQSDSDKVALSDSDKVALSLREQKEINEETTPDVVEDDLVDISFESFYPIAKARLKTSGVLPMFAEYDEDYFKPEIYKFCAWFAKKKLNSNQRLYKLTEWFAKFTVEERKRFYITDEPKHSSYQEFEQEAEPEMTLEEQRRALQAVFGGSNEPA